MPLWTEQSAKAFAAEMERHPKWRVTQVVCEDDYGIHWRVDLQRRDHPERVGVLYGYLDAAWLAKLLNDDEKTLGTLIVG